LAAAAVTWWAVGDLSYTGPSSFGPGLDHLIPPPDISPAAEQLIGTVAAAAGAAACGVLLRPGSSPRKDLRWLAVVLPLLAAAVLLGWGWRVLTAGVIGANIGAGLAVAFGGPLVVAALLWSLIYSKQL